MGTEKVVCPSGLTGMIRSMKTKEANLLADKNAMKTGTAFDTILSSCWVQTLDPGPYTLKNGAPMWRFLIQRRRFKWASSMWRPAPIFTA